MATPRATVAAASPAASPTATTTPVEPAKPPVADDAARAGYYTVKPGDTLIRIGLDTGQNWKDLVRWNNLDNPNVIEVGQVAARGRARRRPRRGDAAGRSTSTRVEPRPLDAARRRVGAPRRRHRRRRPRQRRRRQRPRRRRRRQRPRRAKATTTSPGPGRRRRRSSTPFDEARSKGLVIRGKAGDPVLAAADGRVVYAGSGLRGYGNLVILKHNPTYLTAYAHNQTLLVKDDQAVKRGQKIAEMGSTDADSVQLHFEIRKQGKPIDPARLLPPR